MMHGGIREIIVAGLAVLVLLAFAWLFGRDAWDTLSGRKPGDPPVEIEDPRLYIATAVAALVGAVSAAFISERAGILSLSGEGDGQMSEYVRIAYTIVYLLLGAAAVVAWVQKKGKTPLSLRNLAMTFVGIATAAVGGYLGVEAGLI